MKKLTQILGLSICLLVLTQTSNAQDIEIGFNAGTEIVVPIGGIANFSSFGIGISGGAEYILDDNSGVTFQLGYIFLIPKDDFVSSSSLIPFQFGYKYYLDGRESGLYGHGQLGFHRASVTIDNPFGGLFGGTGDITTSSTGFSLAVGGGYIVNENIDVSLRYNLLTGNLDGGYLGLRAAYNF